jgi:hypothetical protein
MTMTEITIQRPDGNTEKVTKEGAINLKLRGQMEQATKAAGRGQIIGWCEYVQPVKRWATKTHCCSHWTKDQGCPLHGDRN